RTAGRSDVFVAKFAPDGNSLWSRRLGSTDEDIGAAVTTDAYGNVYVAGWFWRQLDILDRPLASAGKKDAFLYALSPAGDGLWARALGGPEDDYGRGLAADEGAVYWAGTFHGTASLGEIELTAAAAPRARLPLGDAFLAVLAR
ncbi:MAG TPA: SBBP repeat-containing protein, partial [Kofleriaceae bacterium]|nr:SBBP repeat-containing protein [Kofleriaceae bacterium]